MKLFQKSAFILLLLTSGSVVNAKECELSCEGGFGSISCPYGCGCRCDENRNPDCYCHPK